MPLKSVNRSKIAISKHYQTLITLPLILLNHFACTHIIFQIQYKSILYVLVSYIQLQNVIRGVHISIYINRILDQQFINHCRYLKFKRVEYLTKILLGNCTTQLTLNKFIKQLINYLSKIIFLCIKVGTPKNILYRIRY